jgi:hypothetical protein
LQNLWLDELLEICTVGTSIEVVSNVTTVHDFTKDVLKIIIWDLLVSCKIVVEYLSANGQISIVEGVVS